MDTLKGRKNIARGNTPLEHARNERNRNLKGCKSGNPDLWCGLNVNCEEVTRPPPGGPHPSGSGPADEYDAKRDFKD